MKASPTKDFCLALVAVCWLFLIPMRAFSQAVGSANDSGSAVAQGVPEGNRPMTPTLTREYLAADAETGVVTVKITITGENSSDIEHRLYRRSSNGTEWEAHTIPSDAPTMELTHGIGEEFFYKAVTRYNTSAMVDDPKKYSAVSEEKKSSAQKIELWGVGSCWNAFSIFRPENAPLPDAEGLISVDTGIPPSFPIFGGPFATERFHPFPGYGWLGGIWSKKGSTDRLVTMGAWHNYSTNLNFPIDPMWIHDMVRHWEGNAWAAAGLKSDAYYFENIITSEGGTDYEPYSSSGKVIFPTGSFSGGWEFDRKSCPAAVMVPEDGVAKIAFSGNPPVVFPQKPWWLVEWEGSAASVTENDDLSLTVTGLEKGVSQLKARKEFAVEGEPALETMKAVVLPRKVCNMELVVVQCVDKRGRVPPDPKTRKPLIGKAPIAKALENDLDAIYLQQANVKFNVTTRSKVLYLPYPSAM